MSKKYILKNGEQLRSFNDTPRRHFPEKKFPRSYEEAAQNLKNDIEVLANYIDEQKDFFLPDEVVVSIELEKGFEAKSYEPKSFFSKMPLTKVGSKIKNKNEDKSKIEYVSVHKKDISSLIHVLDTVGAVPRNGNNSFRENVQIIKSFSVEQDMSTVNLWNDSDSRKKVEIVIHPLNDDKVKKFITNHLAEEANVKFRKLDIEKSPIFAFANITFKEYQVISQLNPVRSAESAELRSFSRSHDTQPINTQIDLNSCDQEYIKNLPKIAIFDGGVFPHELFEGVVDTTYADDQKFPRSISFMEHGSQVAGAAIYGNLSEKNSVNDKILPQIKVEDVPVLCSETTEDLVDAIDYINYIIPKMSDIDVVNISFGPEGGISDDSVSYFTSSLDLLAYRYHKIFVIAVGNDGNLVYPLSRIQAPSDAMNGIGVGSYYKTTENEPKVAEYSSSGYGRESAKVKPDVLDEGGDINKNKPFVTVGSESNKLYEIDGTSFSAPVVARKLAQLMSVSPDISPIVAKALLIQKARTKEKTISRAEGFGFVPENIFDLYTDDDNEVTVVYQDVITESGPISFFVPIPQNFDASKYEIIWTIATMSRPNPADADAYSAFSIQDTFVVDDSSDTRSTTSSTYKTESAARQFDYKWETITKKRTGKKTEKLVNPFLEIHTNRRDTVGEPIDFAIIVTVRSFKNTQSLDEAIQNEYAALKPIVLEEKISEIIDA